MSQTSVIAGSLIVAYFVFVIVRGELPCYLQVLGIATDANCPKGNTGTTAVATTPTSTPATTTLISNIGRSITFNSPVPSS